LRDRAVVSAPSNRALAQLWADALSAIFAWNGTRSRDGSDDVVVGICNDHGSHMRQRGICIHCNAAWAPESSSQWGLVVVVAA